MAMGLKPVVAGAVERALVTDKIESLEGTITSYKNWLMEYEQELATWRTLLAAIDAARSA